MPSTAATVGTRLYLSRCEVCWKSATIASNSSNFPALSDSSAALRFAPTAKGASCQITSAS